MKGKCTAEKVLCKIYLTDPESRGGGTMKTFT